MVLEGRMEAFRAGLAFLNACFQKARKVAVGHASGRRPFCSGVTEAEHHLILRAHPAGNVGVQIHEVRPMNKGEVLDVGMQDVANIGEGLMGGHYVGKRTWPSPAPFTTGVAQAPLECPVSALQDRVMTEDTRVISGNVLTGTFAGKTGHWVSSTSRSLASQKDTSRCSS